MKVKTNSSVIRSFVVLVAKWKVASSIANITVIELAIS